MGKHERSKNPAEPTSGELSPLARVCFGLLTAGLGLIPMLAAFDVGPVRRAEINGPPWLGLVGGALFFAAGLVLLMGQRLQGAVAGSLVAFLMVGGLAAMANWVAFGPGTRTCGVSAGLPFFSSSRSASDFTCRIAFGVGAVFLDGVLLAGLGWGAARLLGPGPLASGLEALSKGVLFLSLAPILVPMVLILLAKAGFDVARVKLGKTGAA